MADPRPFDHQCPIWRASAVFSDPCKLMILRDLFQDGDCNFTAFRAQERGISPNTLSKRLKELVEQGYLSTRLYEKHPPRFAYRLTDRGRALAPVIQAMFDWGCKSNQN